ncbi:hypothetical protein NDU88_002195 [Pleurodeles waltl]|uniref:Uncharacterized protein n=1 Tax=Pleurodeles waltl TaxID=8319 RepID=A0AAV7VYZ6_PLEWA|nr:hypothetical protein NDU88_002195 [Pleurodeles waltl]
MERMAGVQESRGSAEEPLYCNSLPSAEAFIRVSRVAIAAVAPDTSSLHYSRSPAARPDVKGAVMDARSARAHSGEGR